MDYEDFDLDISVPRGRGYPVAVLRSPAGEGHATLRSPLQSLKLKNRLQALEITLLRSSGTADRRRVLQPEEQPVRDCGRDLFEALFTGEVRTCYELSRAEAVRQGKGLRVKLRIESPELAALPWEFLFDPGQDEYVCLSRRTPLVRYLEVSRPIHVLTVIPPLRILGLVASPLDRDRLDIEKEKGWVEAATRDLRTRGLVDLTWLPGETYRDLLRALRSGPWHVFHFTGHGGFNQASDEGVIALADDAGQTALLSATDLGRLLSDHDSLRLVLLNACEGARGSQSDIFSSTAATLIRRGVPAVLAMQYAITDAAAIEFSRSFYEAMASGMAIDAAVTEARLAMRLAQQGSSEWGTPVLYMRAPDGRIFDIATTPSTRDPGEAQKRVVDERRQERLSDLYAQASAHFDAQRWEQAVGAFRKIVEEQTDYKDVASKLEVATNEQECARLYVEGSEACTARDWISAIDRLEALSKLRTSYLDTATRLEEARRQKSVADLYAEARQLQQAQKWDAVVSIFDQIKVLDPAYLDPERLEASARDGLRASQTKRAVRVSRREILLVGGIGAVGALYGLISFVHPFPAPPPTTPTVTAQATTRTVQSTPTLTSASNGPSAPTVTTATPIETITRGTTPQAVASPAAAGSTRVIPAVAANPTCTTVNDPGFGRVQIQTGKCEVAFFFFDTGMRIDPDGAPEAYHPPTPASPWGAPPALDDLRNAGETGNWWGLAVQPNGDPVVQQPSDPAPGFYVSTTSLVDPTFPGSNPRRYVDSTQIPYFVLPTSERDTGRASLGDLAAVYNRQNGQVAFAIYADSGPKGYIGEGSIALAQALGIPAAGRPISGGQEGQVSFVVFPGSGNGRPRSVADIKAITAPLFASWGGVPRIKDMFPD